MESRPILDKLNSLLGHRTKGFSGDGISERVSERKPTCQRTHLQPHLQSLAGAAFSAKRALLVKERVARRAAPVPDEA